MTAEHLTKEKRAIPTHAGNYWSKCLSCEREMENADKRCRICTDCYKEPVVSVPAEKIVMYGTPEAAQVRDVSGWVSGSGRFWGNDEHMARWEGCTHLPCKCGEIIEKSRVRCSKCQTEFEHQEWLKLPLVEWDGETPLVMYRCDQYFFDGESVYEYAEDNGLKVGDLDLVVCVPNLVRELDGYDHCCDELPEDGDIPEELENAVREFNKVVRGLAPLSWSQGNRRVIFPEQDNAE